ncbi:hypothetical protein BJ508DRAFT_313538 [Ascobolus immersus RN42]|uniref:Uncharacterized protein n=1 Tax=Ascobolus immersus RN42 TaxID=1160509 RepID=A0A3N4HIB6_ASCIM|nr:hypothetical protein BJ508DRAFT_313538 [Ascobolus immersus RN42]
MAEVWETRRWGWCTDHRFLAQNLRKASSAAHPSRSFSHPAHITTSFHSSTTAMHDTEPEKLDSTTLVRFINLRIKQIEYQQRWEEFKQRCHAVGEHYSPRIVDFEEARKEELENLIKSMYRLGWPVITVKNVDAEESRLSKLENELAVKSEIVGEAETAIRASKLSNSFPEVPRCPDPIQHSKLSIEKRVEKARARLAHFQTRLDSFNPRATEALEQFFVAHTGSVPDNYYPIALTLTGKEEVTEWNVEDWEKELYRREQKLQKRRMFMEYAEAKVKFMESMRGYKASKKVSEKDEKDKKPNSN